MYVKSISPDVKGLAVECEDYVPLAVNMTEGSPQEIFLRYVSDYSLLEIGVSPNDGVFTSLKLVQVPGVTDGDMPNLQIDVHDGLPVFDLSAWEGKRLFDIENPIELLASRSSLLLSIDMTTEPSHIIKNDFVSFAVFDGRFCWIMLDDLSDEQMKSIMGSVRRNLPGGYL